MAQRVRVTLRDLLRAGLLETGEELVCEPRRGEVYKATLRADGSIYFEGKPFDTPSEWAMLVAGNSRDGWRDVKARGQPLAHFRDSLPARRGGQPTPPIVEQPITPEVGAAPEPSPLPVPDKERQIRDYLLDRIHLLDSREFEALANRIIEKIIGVEIRGTQQSRDQGLDGKGYIPALQLNIAVQAKARQDSPIGIEPVAAFVTRIREYDRGFFVTSSKFTPGAREIAEKEGGKIIMIDGDELVRLLQKYKLGILEEPVMKQEVDQSFFENLGS